MEAGKIDAIGLQKHYIVKRKTSEMLFKKNKSSPKFLYPSA